MAPQIPSGLGPTSEPIIHWLQRLLEREKRQAWEKGSEEKLVGGVGVGTIREMLFSKQLERKGEGVGERNQKIEPPLDGGFIITLGGKS